TPPFLAVGRCDQFGRIFRARFGKILAWLKVGLKLFLASLAKNWELAARVPRRGPKKDPKSFPERIISKAARGPGASHGAAQHGPIAGGRLIGLSARCFAPGSRRILAAGYRHVGNRHPSEFRSQNCARAR